MAFLSKTEVAFDEISKKLAPDPFVAFRTIGIAAAATVKFIYWATIQFSLEPTTVLPAKFHQNWSSYSPQSQVEEFGDKDQD